MASIKLIDKNGGTVSAFQDAQLRHFIKGNDFTGNTIGGIFNGVGDSFSYELNQSNKTFTIKTGIGLLYGRRFSIPPGESVTFNLSNYVGDKKVSIYVVIDTRDSTSEKATIEMDLATINFTSIEKGDNLANTELGVARMLLYQFYYSSNSNTPIYNITKKFYLLDPNVVDIAKKALTLPADSTINSRVVSNIVNSNKDSVKKADSSDTTLALNGNKISEMLEIANICSGAVLTPVKYVHSTSELTVNGYNSDVLLASFYLGSTSNLFLVFGSIKASHKSGNYWQEPDVIEFFTGYYTLINRGKEVKDTSDATNSFEKKFKIYLDGNYLKINGTSSRYEIKISDISLYIVLAKK